MNRYFEIYRTLKWLTATKLHLLAGSMLLLASCNRNGEASDAYGNFEATEIVISASANGQIIEFNIEEGQHLEAGKQVGYIDTIQPYLKKTQLLAARKSIASKTGNIVAQVDVLKAQKETALLEQERFEKLVAQKAATPKQLDDINAQIRVIDAQIKSIQTQNAPVMSEIESIDAQIAQVNDQIEKSLIVNNVKGTVLVKYAEQYEMTGMGKPLYKIADLDTMTLRVYVSGAQLPTVKIGHQVNVLVDNDAQGLDTLGGIVSWIAANAEFTPKTVQTREERVTLVYAVKVRVQNDGSLKIGMPGEIIIN